MRIKKDIKKPVIIALIPDNDKTTLPISEFAALIKELLFSLTYSL